VRAGKKRKGRRKRRKREEGRRGVRWGEGEREEEKNRNEKERKRKRKREKEWDTCHYVGGREKMRLSSLSQFGGDMWQGDISFLFKCLAFH
jgi:hypothetical protein